MSGRGPLRYDRRVGRPCPWGGRWGAPGRRTGAYHISATGPVYRGPGAPATRPTPHHYVFELYALDTVLDVAPSDDAFETRERVMAAMQGHVIGKAVYVGRFRRPN